MFLRPFPPKISYDHKPCLAMVEGATAAHSVAWDMHWKRAGFNIRIAWWIGSLMGCQGVHEEPEERRTREK